MKKKKKEPVYRTDFTTCGDTDEVGVVIWLGTKSYDVAAKRFEKIRKLVKTNEKSNG